MAFSAQEVSTEAPVLNCHWDFGDGTTLDGMKVNHTYTQSGAYNVHVTTMGLDATTSSKTIAISISGNIPTRFVPAEKKRLE